MRLRASRGARLYHQRQLVRNIQRIRWVVWLHAQLVPPVATRCQPNHCASLARLERLVALAAGGKLTGKVTGSAVGVLERLDPTWTDAALGATPFWLVENQHTIRGVLGAAPRGLHSS